MIKYFGFNSSFSLGRIFEFVSSTTGGNSGGSTTSPSGISYLSFPLTHSSANKNAAALPLTMILVNPNNQLGE